jgi:hypothetical protein
MVSSLAVMVGLRLVENVDLHKNEGPNAELFIKLTCKRVSRQFTCFEVSSNDIPDTGIKGTVARSLSEKDLVSSDQDAACTNPHKPYVLRKA